MMGSKAPRILIVDDEEQFRFMLRLNMQKNGFEVMVAESGPVALKTMKERPPDLLLLDLNMPDMDGHEVFRRIKKSMALKLIPVIILTSSDDITDKLRGLENGADDYVTKYQDERELIARVKSVLRRNEQNLDRNPLTGLPGNQSIQKQLLALPAAGWDWAVVYCDLDNFKAYNDYYGFSAGDEVIKFSADVIRDCAQQSATDSDFIGHIGGDDFVFICRAELVSLIADQIISKFDSGIKAFYNEQDRERGFIKTKDRTGNEQEFPLVALSMAGITARRKYSGVAEMMQVLTELKKLSKSQPGSYFALDKRGH